MLGVGNFIICHKFVISDQYIKYTNQASFARNQVVNSHRVFKHQISSEPPISKAELHNNETNKYHYEKYSLPA